MTEEELEYYKELFKLCAIKNCICLICFTILAIVFNEFWIVMFTVLFWSTVKKD